MLGYMSAESGDSEMVEESVLFVLKARIWASWALRQRQAVSHLCLYGDIKQRKIAYVHNRIYAGSFRNASYKTI